MYMIICMCEMKTYELVTFDVNVIVMCISNVVILSHEDAYMPWISLYTLFDEL